MPGAYAHLTLAGLLSASNVLDSVDNFPVAAKISILDNPNFCELGAVSPDYPYLLVVDPDSCLWADLMHHQSIDKIIDFGVESIRMLDGEYRSKSFAWFAGLVSHIVADMTIHPIVNLKVGPYEQNKTDHRICEMHQDAYIFPRLNVGEVGVSEYLDGGIGACSDERNRNKLNKTICSTWDDLLHKCYPAQYLHGAPKIDLWHAAFYNIMNITEEGAGLFALARHVAVNAGLTYPRRNKIDMQYISNLKTPKGEMHYDEIFDLAQGNILRIWALIAAAVYENSNDYKGFLGEEWSLDTGLDANNKLVFWG